MDGFDFIDPAHVRSPYENVEVLAVVATSAWLLAPEDGNQRWPWRPEHGDGDVAGHVELLRALLAEPGRAWVCLAPRLPDGEPQQELRWAAGDAAHDVIGEIGEAVLRISQELRRNATMSTETKNRLLGAARHRVYLNSDRIRAIWPEVEVDDCYALLDFRLVHAQGHLRCHLSVSVWSSAPRYERYRPQDVPAPEPTGLTMPMLTLRNRYGRVVYAIEREVMRHVVQVSVHVLDRVFALPVFWIVIPADIRADPGEYLTGHVPHIDEAVRVLLRVGDARDSVVSHTVLNGRLLVSRRVRRLHRYAGTTYEQAQEAPCYLIVPGGGNGTSPSDEEIQRMVGRCFEALTDFEAEASYRLYDAQAMLEINRNHLAVYNAVVQRGTVLWDALATHLPIRMHNHLARVHRSVELLHQFLIQAVADLGHIAALTREHQAEIRRVGQDLRDGFDSSFTERLLPDQPGLRTVLTETGLMEPVRRNGDDVMQESERVKAAYDDIIRNIGTAFDERRAREADVMQRASAWLGAAVALLGVVTVLDATMDLKPDANAPGALLTRLFGVAPFAWFSLLLGGLQIAGLAVVVLWWLGRLGRLGSGAFRRMYDGDKPRRLLRDLVRWGAAGSGPVARLLRGAGAGRGRTSIWRFLKDTSTGHLEMMRWEITEWDKWDLLDRRHSAEFAKLWDATTGMHDEGRRNRVGRDIRSLARLIEQWGMHSLLLTERARRMYRYPLPRLTCVYRCATGIRGPAAPASFLDLVLSPRPEAVALVDLAWSLGRLGFTWEETEQIDRWLRAHPFDSAAEVLAHVDRLRLRVPMSLQERRHTLTVVADVPTPA